ncbi:MAG: helix-turn-helix domain-containing protein [Lewinellaceae bacterium]|nr:helix-turn-helix domain-containing protein [Lewinellaceae bacterium]
MTTGQAARELSLAPGTLQNWRTEGIGPKFFKHRHRVFYLVSDIEAYKKENYIFCSSTADWKKENG